MLRLVIVGLAGVDNGVLSLVLRNRDGDRLLLIDDLLHLLLALVLLSLLRRRWDVFGLLFHRYTLNVGNVIVVRDCSKRRGIDSALESRIKAHFRANDSRTFAFLFDGRFREVPKFQVTSQVP